MVETIGGVEVEVTPDRIRIGNKIFFRRRKAKPTDGDCAGYFRRLKWDVRFYDRHGELFACCVDNKHNEQFFVTAWVPDGEKSPRYLFALSNKDRASLGLPDSYGVEIRVAETIAEQTRPARA